MANFDHFFQIFYEILCFCSYNARWIKSNDKCFFINEIKTISNEIYLYKILLSWNTPARHLSQYVKIQYEALAVLLLLYLHEWGSNRKKSSAFKKNSLVYNAKLSAIFFYCLMSCYVSGFLDFVKMPLLKIHYVWTVTSRNLKISTLDR